MPSALPNLYTLPSDVFDLLSTQGTELALDDNHQATGQTIQVTAAAVTDDVLLYITALEFPLLRGTVLQFNGAGMESTVQVTLTATGQVGDTTLTVVALSADVNLLATATDSGVNLAMAARLAKACKYGTSQVQLYCLGRYNDSDLVNSWSVNRWATSIAARWVAKRVYRACPQGLQEDFEETKEELKQVKAGVLNVESIGTRSAGWPFMSNVTVDIGYTVAKVRVEPQISEATPTQFPQHIDWNSIFLIEY